MSSFIDSELHISFVQSRRVSFVVVPSVLMSLTSLWLLWSFCPSQDARTLLELRMFEGKQQQPPFLPRFNPSLVFWGGLCVCL